MSMIERNRRPIGRILVDGGFLSPLDLEKALEEQRRTSELLGQVLVRMGVLDPAELKAALSIQEYLDHPDEAVKTAAGVRQMLGSLLLQAGHITGEQLDYTLAEQKKSGEKLGEVLMRLGLLTERQLNAVLDFQQNQSVSEPPHLLRLGELLISAGYISRIQLDDALYKQALSGKKLGDVLVEEGYAEPHHIKHGMRLQHMLLTAVLVTVLTACGGGGGGGAKTQVDAVEEPAAQEEKIATNYLEVTTDGYGLLTPTFYYSSDNDSYWSIQAAIAEYLYDPDFQTVIRIDVPKENGVMPSINKTFSIEDNGRYEKFPGSFFVFNGKEFTNNKVEQGTLAFTPDSTPDGRVEGSFDVVLTDYDSGTVPAPQYPIKGSFSFEMGTYGAATPLPAGTS